MDRTALATGVTGGSLSAILVQLLADFAHPTPLQRPICPEALDSLLAFDWGVVEPYSLAIGLVIGLSAGPVLDLLWLLRQHWRVWVRRQTQVLSAGPAGSPLYKLA